jgi:hypothetical protein
MVLRGEALNIDRWLHIARGRVQQLDLRALAPNNSYRHGLSSLIVVDTVHRTHHSNIIKDAKVLEAFAAETEDGCGSAIRNSEDSRRVLPWHKLEWDTTVGLHLLQIESLHFAISTERLHCDGVRGQ